MRFGLLPKPKLDIILTEKHFLATGVMALGKGIKSYKLIQKALLWHYTVFTGYQLAFIKKEIGPEVIQIANLFLVERMIRHFSSQIPTHARV